MFRNRWVLGALAMAVLGTPGMAAAQYDDWDRDRDRRWHDDDEWPAPKAEVSIFGLLAVPQGQFENYVDLGGGFGASALGFLNRNRTAAIRLDGTMMIYGHESFRTPLSPTVPFVDVDVSTTNYVASLGVGPQIYFGTGAIRPYIFGTVGFSYFATRSSVSGSHEVEAFASTTNFDDFTMSLTGGGGISVNLSQGETPVSLDIGTQYVRNGLAQYLTKGDLYELPGGGWGVRPVVSETNLMNVRVGVTIGIR